MITENYEKAFGIYKEVLDLQPENNRAKIGMVDALTWMWKLDQAKRLMRC